MLTDRDGDGRFDHATTFADNLTLPMGALWHDGALYVASPPYIWKLRDTDDDGVADERVNLAGQFGYSGNAASVHGCFLGPEGRIYWCDGRHGHEFRDDSGAVIGKGDGSYIFSCWPDGSDLRMHCGGGMDNPVEVDFTETGEMLGTVNILLRNPRVDCLVHWLHGGAYPHHERVLGEFVRTGDLLGPVHEFGHVAVSGMTRYRSGILDRDFRDDLFVSVFNLGQVLRVEVTREGASFRATEHEFLRSTSPDCHPTDVLEDADGSLLVVDTGGWFRIGCPTSQIAKPEIKGGIYRVRRKGMPQFADPRGHAIDWENISPREVSARLAETRPAVVERALAECGRRANAEMIAALRRTLARADSHVRRNAVWGLSRIRRAEATSAILPALEDDASHVRLAACHALAAQPIAAAVQPLIKLLAPAEPPAVRREAATALGRTGQAKEVIPALMTALPNVVDRTEEHAILYALIELGDVDALGPYLAAASPVQRRGALIAISELDDSVLDSKTVLACATADDVPLSRTAIEILSEHPEWAEAGAEVIRQTVRAAEGAELSVGVRNLIGRLAAEAKTAAVIGEVLADSDVENALKVSFLEALQEGGDTPLHSSWEAPIHRALVSNHAALRLAAIQTTAALKSNAFDDVLRTITADESHSAIVRLAALESLQQRRPTLTPTSFAFLLEMLADETAGPLRMRTARLISGSQLSDSQLLELTERLAVAGPLEIHDLILPFKTCRQNDIWERFASVVRVAPGFASLQPTEIEVLWKAAGAEVVALQRLVTELEEQRAAQTARLAELVAQIDGGDPQAGRAVFMSEKAKCSTCHRVKNAGGRIGPDLSRIGRIRQRRDLLEAIVFPSASFVREFQPYQVIDTRGRVLSGLVAREDETSILLQPQTGDPIRLARDDIERIVPAHVSIMPAGLDRLLSREELANLVLDDFEETTGIKVALVGDTEATKSLGLVQRLLRERRHPQCDLFWNNQLLGTVQLAEEGLLVPYESPHSGRFPESARDAQDRWAGFGARMRVWIVNTENMDATEEAIEQRLAGDDLSKMAIAQPMYGTTLSHYSLLWELMGGDALQAWHHSLVERKTIVIPNTVALIQGGRHDAAARLLVDTLLSAETELDLARSPSRQIPLGDVPADAVPGEVRQLAEWAQDAHDLSGLGPARAACLEWLQQEYAR
ncbi:Arylsulfatase [Durusdinium trenchii]|uniref:Arylsulfatase n=1 Tax=Durusdinium trenchii TaxID=1381693 RepID=A0ABP0HT78_9DINO